jgi:cytochrome c
MSTAGSSVAVSSAVGALALVIAVLVGGGSRVCAGAQVGNAPPVVKITAPANGSTHAWNTLVSYHIVVSYRGKSTQYQELPASGVLLQATYVPKLSALAGKHVSAAHAPPAGLRDILGSNCLGCHDFKGKAMAPSFAAIAKRYPDTPATLGLLSQHIRVGSTGIWGPDSMPSHPELTDLQLHDIVLWIMRDASNPDLSYYVGTDGALRMQASSPPGGDAGMVLTASYAAPAAGHGPVAHGEDTVILRGR